MLFSFVGAGHTQIQKRIQQERTKAGGLAKQLREKRARLNAVSARVQSLKSQLAQTNAAMSVVRSQLGALSQQERSLQARISWNSIQLAAAQRSLAFQDGLLRKRLVGIYEYGEPDYLSVLLSATPWSSRRRYRSG